MTTFRIVPERSTLEIEARSSLHPIHGAATGLGGTIEAVVSEGRLDLDAPAALRLEVPVAQLSSGNALYDGELQRRLDARRYPRIIAEAKEVRAGGAPDRYAVSGNVTAHGVTRPVRGELTIGAPDERTLTVEGEQRFDIREFNITPPRIALLKVNPEVKVALKIIAEREG